MPCDPSAPTGPLAAEEFLRKVVPAIEASPAYEEGGLIAITSTQAPQAGPEPDTSACCVSPPYPNLPTLLGLERLGYANEPALVPFGETVFNAAVGEEAPLRQRRGLERSRFRRR